ncbi:MAG: NADH-quinone oxidoreductase subunit NuoK [Methermicoccaceae archaeon]
MIPITAVLALAATMFAIGIFGMLIAKTGIRMLMAIEILMNSANITLVGFSNMHGDAAGQVFALFVMALAAAETVVGLAILLVIFRQKKAIDVDNLNILRW